jgi:hypothetical protein
MPAMNEPSPASDGDRPYPTGSDRRRPDGKDSLPRDARVQIRSRFDGAWASGFEVFAAQPSGGYLVRRTSDRVVLPVTFAATELRLEPMPMPTGRPGPWSPPSVA